ncbi:MAG: DUF2934 domain-containing protein [Opitutaceae bacterium]|jgi:hypothetical protein
MHSPTHEEISRCAETIWQDRGRPAGRDDEIWLEAERQLAAKSSHSPSLKTEHAVVSPTLGEGHSDHALAERASEQRKEAMAPQYPAKSAPKAQPPETGKPLWSKPHSR